MAHPHHCLVTQKLQTTYFDVLYANFIIGPNVWSHYDQDGIPAKQPPISVLMGLHAG